MPLIPGTRPGGGKPIKMPPTNTGALTGKYLKAKNEEELEYSTLDADETIATKIWVEENYTHELIDGGNF